MRFVLATVLATAYGPRPAVAERSSSVKLYELRDGTSTRRVETRTNAAPEVQRVALSDVIASPERSLDVSIQARNGGLNCRHCGALAEGEDEPTRTERCRLFLRFPCGQAQVL